MTIYLDRHPGTAMKGDAAKEVSDRIASGERDEHGVIDRGVLMDKEADMTYCVLDAPDVDAVIRHHEALGLELDADSIHEADAIL